MLYRNIFYYSAQSAEWFCLVKVASGLMWRRRDYIERIWIDLSVHMITRIIYRGGIIRSGSGPGKSRFLRKCSISLCRRGAMEVFQIQSLQCNLISNEAGISYSHRKWACGISNTLVMYCCLLSGCCWFLRVKGRLWADHKVLRKGL